MLTLLWFYTLSRAGMGAGRLTNLEISMTQSFKYAAYAIAGALIALAGFFAYYTAYANPSRLQTPVSCSTQGVDATALSTTTRASLSAGTGTSTLTCNMGIAGDGTQVWDSAKLAIQLTASSTATELRWRYEYSNDGVDWYADTVNNAAATATTTIEVRTFKEYSWLFASSTPGGITTPQGRALKYVDVPVGAKYVRVVFYLPPGSLNALVWANLVGKVERAGTN